MATPSSESSTKSLMSRGKRSVAIYFKSECSRHCGQEKLNDLLNHILNPSRPIDEFETLDWLKLLISGGSTFDSFAKTVRQYDNAVTCGLVWTANFVAYRCRTCGISPCMSLCSDCFQGGNHDGHDFNMFRSQAGGACDCGDVNVMNSRGFCERHGPERRRAEVFPPQDLLAVAEAMMPRVFLRFLYHLRQNSTPEMVGTFSALMDDAEQFLGFLHSLSDMGAAMRRVMTKALTNPNDYKAFTTIDESEGGFAKFYVDSQTNYTVALTKTKYPLGFENFKDKNGLNQTLEHCNILDELVFWMVKFEFPQKMVTLLLSLLPDDEYKEAFTRSFVKHYSRISVVLVDALNRSTIANRIVHISVQLFSNETLALKMAEEYNLLYIVIISLTNMIEGIATESTIQDASTTFHSVVECGSAVMKDHCYWPIISDLLNLLSHSPITKLFLNDNKLIGMWLKLLEYLQAMNLNQRELNQHVEFEPDTYYASFSAELEISSSPMWCLISHCKSKDCERIVKAMIDACLFQQQEWFEAINCTPAIKPNAYQLTFHLPLHRYLATFMMHAVLTHGISLDSILPSENILKMLLVHPLQIQIGITEVYCSMWVRNGLQIKGQAMSYVQCHFCYSMVDLDIYLMQVCASKLDPEYFVQTVLDRFHLQNWLSFSTTKSNFGVHLSSENAVAMLEGALAYFVTLLSERIYLGIEDKDLARLEMSSLLAVNDRQHSQLLDMMPERSGMSGYGKELFEPTLKEIANYKAPNFEAGGSLQQGTYVPKACVWEEDFDPIHVLLRSVYRKDFQSAMDRYTEYIRQHKNYQKKTSPWPPFKQPRDLHPDYLGLYRILHCRTMHAFLFIVLLKALREPNIPESILYYAVYLLELAVTLPNPNANKRMKQSTGTVTDGEFLDWFSSTNIFQNAQESIEEIKVTVISKDDEVDSSESGILTTLEEMFQIAPTTFSTSSGVVTSSQVVSHLPIISLPGPSDTTSIFPLPRSSPAYESRGVSTDPVETIALSVKETILSLLLKLHAKFSGKSNIYQPLSKTDRKMSDSRVGDAAHFIEVLLDKISQADVLCAKKICDIHKQLYPTEEHSSEKKSKGKQPFDKDNRRMKAQARQKKLMEEFASKQKAFMEQAMEADDDDGVSEEETPKVKEILYDCVICGQSSLSTATRPIGLVVFLQATSVLGHRQQSERKRELPVADSLTNKLNTSSCGEIQKKRLETLFKQFEESSCQMSVNIGWEGGVLVQTCGHHLHLDCYNSYLSSLRNESSNRQTLSVDKGEYWCPLCRQLSNSVVPIVPEETKLALVKPVSQDSKQMALDIAAMMLNPPITPSSETITNAMASMMGNLSNTTYPQFKTYSKSGSAESVLNFVCSVARTNLEIDLLQRGGVLDGDPTALKKNCFLPIMHVLSIHSKILTLKPYTDLWTQITGVSMTEEESTSLLLFNEEVPILLKDVTSLLIQVLLTLPVTIDKEHYCFVVQMLYNVAYVQALVVTSCQFTSEERDAWKRKGRNVSLDTMEGLMSHVITRLSCSRLYEDMAADSSSVLPAICQSVWSPQSVEAAVQESLLPFLKIASLIKFHLFDFEFSDREGLSEFVHCCKYLQLHKFKETNLDVRQLNSSSFMYWIVEGLLTLTRAWFSQLIDFVNAQPAEGKQLLLISQVWLPPSLISLPKEYYKIFQYYRTKKCQICLSAPKEPAICLVCGQFLCFRDPCCSQNYVYECVSHSISCGAGTGLFLAVNSSIVFVIRGTRATLWGSVYLDEHAEEDRDLKRGKPLFLSMERYKLLEHQWLSHRFDHVCKKWIWHLNRL